MVIKQITAENIKFYLNTISVDDLKKIGLKMYLDKFLVHARASEEIFPLMETIRVNGEKYSTANDIHLEEEKVIEKKHKKAESTGNGADRVKLCFAYSSYSSMDHNYSMISDNRILDGLECKKYSFELKEDTIPYFPTMADEKIICDGLELKLHNEDASELSFDYPELCIYKENNPEPLVSISFWEDEIADAIEPNEVFYMENISSLAEELADKIKSFKVKELINLK